MVIQFQNGTQYVRNDVIGFLALLYATAQQSYCRHVGVRHPSVRS